MIDYPDEVIATSYKDQRVDPNTGRVYSARSMQQLQDLKVQKRLKELPMNNEEKIKKR